MSGEDLSWAPTRCYRGHPMGPGRVSFSFTACDCEAGKSGQPRGHHNAFCRADGCWSEYWPPGCDGRSANPGSITAPVKR